MEALREKRCFGVRGRHGEAGRAKANILKRQSTMVWGGVWSQGTDGTRCP